MGSGRQRVPQSLVPCQDRNKGRSNLIFGEYMQKRDAEWERGAERQRGAVGECGAEWEQRDEWATRKLWWDYGKARGWHQTGWDDDDCGSGWRNVAEHGASSSSWQG